jgi:hypothetical protein
MKYFSTRDGYVVDENNLFIPMDESSPLYPDYLQYVISGGDVLPTIFLTDIEIEFDLNCIRQECSFLISSIEGFQEAIERKIIDDIVIPQHLLDKRNEIKESYRIRKEEYLRLLS